MNRKPNAAAVFLQPSKDKADSEYRSAMLQVAIHVPVPDKHEPCTEKVFTIQPGTNYTLIYKQILFKSILDIYIYNCFV